MGKFAIDFSEEVPRRIYERSTQEPLSFVVAEEPVKEDSAVQKALCYFSYYIMTFTAFCVFTPQKVAYAAAVIKGTIPG